MPTRRILQVDGHTGEVQEGALCWVPKRALHPYGDRWMMLHQDKSRELAQDPNLKGNDFRVYLYLFSVIDYENFIQVSQAELSRELGINRPNVSRAFARLIKHGVVIAGPKVGNIKTYRLNSEYGYKGKVTQLQKAMPRDRKLRIVSNSPPRDPSTVDMFADTE